MWEIVVCVWLACVAVGADAGADASHPLAVPRSRDDVVVRDGEVVCSVEEYVRVGLEFESCQKLAMVRFVKSGQKDICPAIKRMEDVCSSSVKRCFTPRGYERGRQIFFDSMSEAMPEVRSCPVVAESSTGIDRLVAGERCSVREEIDTVQAVTRCSVQMKSKIARMVQSRGILRGSYNEDDGTFSFLGENYDGGGGGGGSDDDINPEEVSDRQRTILCSVLGTIREKCILPNLRRCYAGHDYDAHLAFLMESLKISGNLIAIALTNVTDVPDCPVFATEPMSGGYGRNGDSSSSSSSGGNATVAAVVAAAATVAVLALLGGLALLVVKLRLVPRVKAWAANVPYDDMLVQPNKGGGGGGGRGRGGGGGGGGGAGGDDDSPNVQAMQRRSSERETEERQQQQQQQQQYHPA